MASVEALSTTRTDAILCCQSPVDGCEKQTKRRQSLELGITISKEVLRPAEIMPARSIDWLNFDTYGV
jgi:hypothetical protein